jgi:hypothetical protein
VILILAPTWALRSVSATDLGAATIELIDGSQFNGSIQSIDASGGVLGEGVPLGLKVSEILSIQTDRQPQSGAESEITIHLVGGGKLMAGRPSMAGEKTRFQSDVGVSELPLQSIRAIVWSSSPGVQAAIKEPSAENDKVIVQTDAGERTVEGVLEGIDAEQIQLNYQGESRKIGLSKIKAIVTADLGFKKPDGSMAAINLLDGSQIVGVVSELTDGILKITLAGDASVGLKTEAIENIAIASDRILFLSDAQPIDVQEKSVFAIQRPWKRNRSVEDNPLRLGSDSAGKTSVFKKGLGTQAFCRLEFANTNEFDRFNAIVGIDAETGGRGDCQVVVRGDGIELWSQRVRATDDPHKVGVDITGIKKITLIVYPGEEFDLGDHVDWCDARFLKTK